VYISQHVKHFLHRNAPKCIWRPARMHCTFIELTTDYATYVNSHNCAN